MFRPYMWAIFKVEISLNLEISYTRCVGRLGEGVRDLVVSIVGIITLRGHGTHPNTSHISYN